MAKVLNGEVRAGDRVAYATRVGNRAAIHLGTVVEVVTVGYGYGRTGPGLKVRIEVETGQGGTTDRIRTVSTLDRVVKL